MKIVHLTPGSGGNFYCKNCLRDKALLSTFMDQGHDVQMIPMYLPLNVDDESVTGDAPIFYGAINMYLKEKVPLWRYAPGWLTRFFDSYRLLNFAAKQSKPTQTRGLEEMTLSMLRGEDGRQSAELDQLIQYLKTEVKPDIVHLSNALLMGVARSMKKQLGAAIVCSLQDENEWIDLMGEAYQSRVWNIMADRADDVDRFVAPSHCFAELSQKRMRIPPEKVRIVYDGINFKGYEQSGLPFDPPVIGYLCRMSEYFGLDILVDAYIQLKNEKQFRDLKLYMTGGYSREDKSFVNGIQRKLSGRGYLNDVRIFKTFERNDRIRFLKDLTLLSVPVPGGEAFGTYLLEALAAGVPVVQPHVGCYPEFIEITNGGIIYEPNRSENLANAMATLLLDPEKTRLLGNQGRESVINRFSIEEMTKQILQVYEELSV